MSGRTPGHDDRAATRAVDQETWDLHLDPREVERRKAEWVVRLNTVVIPRLRVLGFALIAVGILLHNQLVLGDLS